MNLVRSRSVVGLVCGLFVCPTPARASTSGGPVDTDTDTDTYGDSGRDDCGGTCDATAVSISSPLAAAEVATSFSVTVEGSDGCSCDACGCYDVAAQAIALWVDGAPVDSCTGCTSPHTFELELPPGEHALVARAEYDFHGESSEAVTVTVSGELTTTGGMATTGGEPTTGSVEPTGSASSGAAPQAGDDGGGCSIGGGRSPVGLGGLLLLLLVARRRDSRQV